MARDSMGRHGTAWHVITWDGKQDLCAYAEAVIRDRYLFWVEYNDMMRHASILRDAKSGGFTILK